MKIELKGKSGGKDRRGLMVLAYRYAFTDMTDVEALETSLPNAPEGLVEVDRRVTEWTNNTNFIVQATFEGIVSDPVEDQDQYAMTTEWREEPIEAFPDREKLEKEFGAYEDPESGRLKFPETLDANTTGGTPLGRGKKTSTKNPLFGTTTYPVGRSVAVHSYVRRTKPPGLKKKAGRVVQSLPAGFEEEGDSTWIQDHPQTRKRGNCWEIVERWKDVDDLKNIHALYVLLGKQ